MIISEDDRSIILDADERLLYGEPEGLTLRKIILTAVHAIVKRGRHSYDIELCDDSGALMALFTVERRSAEDYSISIMVDRMKP